MINLLSSFLKIYSSNYNLDFHLIKQHYYYLNKEMIFNQYKKLVNVYFLATSLGLISLNAPNSVVLPNYPTNVVQS